ncbi:flagellar hook-associated protein FlgL [Pilimelia terevasa]|uniref:Flagellin n=1 Tax=Pilimelia terevasa TaxID=53372 RepID=A0A8J3BKT5_9ACTN|nr:flagellin [Pilimelia terevasa]GGK18299.1 flagellar hook-associated protein FlgL [Pilimelia terevasa]
MALSIRSTQQSVAARVMRNLQSNLHQTGRLQEQLSSGKLISRPSDSPTGAVSSLQLRGQIRALEQYTRNADDGIGWLGTLDNTMTTSLDHVRRARDLVLTGRTASTSGSVSAREALAVEVENIRDALIDLSNTKYLDRPVFGGTTSGPAAYTAAGVYDGEPTGPNRTVDRAVGDGTTVRVDVTGPEVFGADGTPTQMFELLTQIATDLRAGNQAGLGTGLDNLDTAMNNIQTQLANVGSKYNRVEQMRQTARDRILSLETQLSDVEDIDLPKTIMEMQIQQTAYQAALSTTARVIQPSLVDFLR